ncbi:hypothetical protein P6N65_003555 [Klebsiella pneumoniae]|uniref:hypothetical protein n=1 Tax=Klebsiella aerogenes TaxID=548 RepID=UPI001BCAF678|nr:hypothetical protein [Klebsiella aerogenes]EKQ6499085.1 hypothetical protein [Klebsiella pneumoniae]
MTTDITELAQSEINDALAQLKQISEYPTPSTQYARVLRKYITSQAEALEKAQGMEAYWKTQCRGITDHCEGLQARIAELEEAEQKLCSANVTLDARAELAERQLAELESRTVTVKLPDDEDGQAYGFGKWANGKLPATAGTMTIAYCEDAWRAAFEVFSSTAGIKVETE